MMTAIRRILSLLPAAAGICVVAACAEPTAVERADGGSTGQPTDGDGGSNLDEAAIIELAGMYATELVQLSETREFEETHADAASVLVWGSASAVEDFQSIDPDDPTQVVEFAPGTMFVKEHFGADDSTIGFTAMYKAEAGYDPDGRDWFWARVNEGTVTDSGRVGWCSSCHAAAHNSDFVVGFGKSP